MDFSYNTTESPNLGISVILKIIFKTKFNSFQKDKIAGDNRTEKAWQLMETPNFSKSIFLTKKTGRELGMLSTDFDVDMCLIEVLSNWSLIENVC